MSEPATVRLPSDREFVLVHTFRASAARVFAAYTDPEQIPHWWAPAGGSVRVDRMDVRPGGTWRFVQRAPGGPELVFGGTYLEVRPVNRLVYTFSVEGQPDSEFTATIELTESAGVTHLTMTSRCRSKEARDAMLRYGAVAGAGAAWARLAAALNGG